MAIIDKIGTGAKNAAKKASEMAQISKLNGMIASEEKNIEESTYEIGRIYFENYKDTNLDGLTQLCQNILDSQQKIKDYEFEIKVVKGIKFCRNCNNEVPENSTFCPTCGAKIAE